MTTAAPGFTRYTQDKCCPICGGWDRMPRGSGQRCYGYLTATGKTAMCTREEKAGNLPLAAGSEAYAHPLHGPCGCGAGEGDSADHSGHRKGTRRRSGGKVEKRYDYRDERGEILFQVERLWPKAFRQRSPDGQGGWREGQGAMREVRLVLYRLPELLADTKRMVFCVEGEKNTDLLRDGFGLPATCNPMGAGKWTAAMVQTLVDRQRVPFIIPDNDPAGIRGADKVATLLHAAGLRPRVLPVLGEREGFDVYDWALEEQGSREQLLEMAKDAPLWIPPNVAPLDLPEMQPSHGGPNGTVNSNGFHHGPDGLPAFTDTRNAERLVERFGEGIRKDFTRGKKRALGGWRLWDGMRWFLDETELIVRRAKEVVNHLPDEIPDHLHHETVKKLQRDCLGCESTGRLHALITNAGNLVATTHADWDSDPWLLNCRNGTVDLHSGELLEHDPARYLSKMAPVDYDPEMPTPVWDAFIERVFAGDQSLIAFVQRAIGLSLVGKVIEHVLFVMYGTGANGKSTFTNVWLELLGDYSRAAGMDLLVETKNPQHPTSIAELVGMRFIATAEVQGQFSERVVKLLTGGDVRNARFLFEDAFTYTPSDTFWLATNHKPTITGNSEGIWRRIRLLPFAVTVPPSEQDAALPAKLRAEFPGILAWAVRGCLDWQRDGLGSADAVDAATATYRGEMDTMATFLADRCVVGPTTRSLLLICTRPSPSGARRSGSATCPSASSGSASGSAASPARS